MVVNEQARRNVYVKLESTIGPEAANSLMELLPLHSSGELVTREDMFANTARLQGEMAELRGEMAELRAELKGEMAELRAELKGEMAELRAEVKGDIAQLRGEMMAMRGEFMRWGAVVVGANAVAMVTALIA